MARVQNNGMLSGPIGDLIYYVVNGKQYVRKKGEYNDANTKKQQHHRAKVRACGKFLSQFREVIKLGYQGGELAYNDYNEAVKYHLANAFEDITPEGSSEVLYRVMYEKVNFSRGLISAPEIYTCERTGQSIELMWNSQLGPYPNRHSDALALVAYIPGEIPLISYHQAVRHEGHAIINLPAKYNQPVHVWLFYYNAEKTTKIGKECSSNSIYMGQL